MSIFDKTEQILVKLSSLVAVIGGLGLIFATLATCVSILLKLSRRMLDTLFADMFETVPWEFIRPILGEEELVTYGVGLALYCALPWVTLQKGHIRINLFENLLGMKFNRFLDLLCDVALAVIAYLILTRQWFLIFKKALKSQESMTHEIFAGNFEVLSERLRDNQESQIIGLPLWPTYVVAEFCTLLFFIVAVLCVFRSAKVLFTWQPS